MNTPNETNEKRVRAEAASWVTRLHGPDRSESVELGLRRWLAEEPAHAVAFEKATEVWQDTADLPAVLPDELRAPKKGPVYLKFAVAAGLAGLLLAGAWSYFKDPALTTGIGEQRTLALEDGTRVELNTHSRLVVQYDERSRTVVLESGEAFFDVARQAERPFVVVAGSRKIMALGTTFLVRKEANEVLVTLVDGKVAVAPVDAPEESKVMVPGQRLRFGRAGKAILDSPSIEKVTAWQRGQLIFEDTPLREAVAEFNRYGSTQIEVASPEAEEIPVGGVFRIGDFASFADAVAASHHLKVETRGERLILTGSPLPSDR